MPKNIFSKKIIGFRKKHYLIKILKNKIEKGNVKERGKNKHLLKIISILVKIQDIHILLQK